MQEEPFFNLKAVVQQTGLKPDTLRAWERRYGLPNPERSSGGHRLYSRHDIAVIKWLMARQQEGLSIKRAVQLWEQIESEGRDPLRVPMPIAQPSTVAVEVPSPEGETLVQLREAWIDACLSYDEQGAERVANQAFALFTPETVCLDLLQKAIAEIGRGWYEGDVTVQQEHFCSALAIRRVESLVMASPPPTRPGRILATCAPQEEHVFGLLVLTLLLRRRGWEVVYLGPNVPVERLETTVAATDPQLVILAAQRLHSAARLLEAAQLLQAEETSLAYGGLIFNVLPSLRERIPGHFLGERLDQVPEAVERLMTFPRPLPELKPVPEIFRQAREHFAQREGFIEASVVRDLGLTGIRMEHLAMANRELGLNIGAALALGNLEYLGVDIEWLKGLMGNYSLPLDVLRAYLVAYREAAREHLDTRGEPIVAWLDRVIQHNGFE